MLKNFKGLGLFFGVSLIAFVGVISMALADGPAVPAGTDGAAGAPGAPGMGSMLLPMVLMFGIVYFLMIRPQQKKMKEQQSMIQALKDGDEVITTSGILGTVAGMTDKVVTVEVASNVKIKMLKSQISQVVKGHLNDLESATK